MAFSTLLHISAAGRNVMHNDVLFIFLSSLCIIVLNLHVLNYNEELQKPVKISAMYII